MTDTDRSLDLPLAHLPTEEKARRSGSFGAVADHYARYRPGPPPAAVEWLVPDRLRRVIDLGAGTGALSRLLLDRADEVVAVEPDARMRRVLASEVPGVRVVDGRGESMPLPDGCAEAVLASSSWHWMDVGPALAEVGRVLGDGGILGAIWSGPDPEGPDLARWQALLASRPTVGGGPPDKGGAPGSPTLADLVLGDGRRPTSRLEIPTGSGFSQPQHQVFRWSVALNADQLVGLLGTFSWIIDLAEGQRRAVLAEARRLLTEVMGLGHDATFDVAYRAIAWRSHHES